MNYGYFKETVATTDNAGELMQTIMRYRDVECIEHLERTKRLMRQLLKQLEAVGYLDKQCQPLDMHYITRAAIFHDLGKIVIPDSILQKPAALTESERQIMKAHTWMGAQIARQMEHRGDPRYVQHLTDICAYHHENWDGTGYPAGLSGENIPYSARLMHVVDVYDALVSKRPYKDAFSKEAAIAYMKSERGKLFDPIILDTFTSFI